MRSACEIREMIAETVYALCTATSALCAWLLLRAYRRSATRILLWSGLAFVGLTFSNGLYYADLFVFRNVDLSVWRTLPSLSGLALLCYGLIWEST